MAKKKENVYTGTEIIGIAQMHKSNAVPVRGKKQATEVANMKTSSISTGETKCELKFVITMSIDILGPRYRILKKKLWTEEGMFNELRNEET